jgi:hypothetical protein
MSGPWAIGLSAIKQSLVSGDWMSDMSLSAPQVTSLGAEVIIGGLQKCPGWYALSFCGVNGSTPIETLDQILVALENHPTLQILRFDSVQIPLAELCRTLERNTVLRELELVECDLSGPQIVILFNSFKKNTSLESLRFSQISELLNTLDDEEQTPLASYIDSNNPLRRLDVSGSKCLTNCVVQFFHALNNCKSVEILTLNQQRFEDEDAFKHFPLCVSLLEIKLPFLPHGTIQTVVESLKKCSSLSSLSFARAQAFGHSDVVSLSSLLELSSSISSISLQSVIIQEEKSLDVLSRSLSNSALMEINISNCYVGNSMLGCKLSGDVFIDSVCRMKSLQVLSLPDCDFIAEISDSIQNLLIQNEIQELNLSGNKLGDLFIRFISKELGNNSSLRMLNLERIGLKLEGAIHLARILSRNQSLVQLSCDENSLGSEGVISILQASSSCCTLLHLSMVNVSISDEEGVLRTIEDTLGRNDNLLRVDLDEDADVITEDFRQTLEARLASNKKKLEDSTLISIASALYVPYAGRMDKAILKLIYSYMQGSSQHLLKSM